MTTTNSNNEITEGEARLEALWDRYADSGVRRTKAMRRLVAAKGTPIERLAREAFIATCLEEADRYAEYEREYGFHDQALADAFERRGVDSWKAGPAFEVRASEILSPPDDVGQMDDPEEAAERWAKARALTGKGLGR